MTDVVKSRRAYNADGRRAQGAATRLAVLEAARELFLANGYAGTSIPAVARAAGVSPELIYKSFGPKPALLKAVFDVSVAGDDDPITLEAMIDLARARAFYEGTLGLALVDHNDVTCVFGMHGTMLRVTPGGIVVPPRLAPPRQHRRQRHVQPGHPDGLDQSNSPGLRHQAGPARVGLDTPTGPE